MEIHHIIPRSKGGDDSADNGIPLCLDCHAEVGAYNPKHPKGRKFTASELKRHKEQWFAIAAQAPWHQSLTLGETSSGAAADLADLLRDIEVLELWNPDVSARFLPSILALNDDQRVDLVAALDRVLREHSDDNARWNAGIVVEFLVEWSPLVVPNDLLVLMSEDTSFSVRSSAAVSYCQLALMSPQSVPLDVLARLASYDEDWYVQTPATSALLLLARARWAAPELLARGIDDEDPDVRAYAASALKQLIVVAPAALRFDIAEKMLDSNDPQVVEVGRLWRTVADGRRAAGKPLDHGVF